MGYLRRTDVSTFVTLLCLRLQPSTGEIDYVDAGHGLTLIIQADGRARQLASDGLPIGVLSGETWNVRTARLEPADTLLSVSDGYLDLFTDPVQAGRAAIEVSQQSNSAQEMADRLSLLGAKQAPLDDVTAVVVRREER